MVRCAIVVGTVGGGGARLAPFLDLLGIEWEVLSATAFLRRYGPEILAGREIGACLILCGESLKELRAEADKSHIPPASIGKAFAASLICSFDSSPSCLDAIRDFFDAVRVAAAKISTERLRYRISAKYPEMCGALTGLSFESSERAVGDGVEFELRAALVHTIISLNEASVLSYARVGTRELFIAPIPQILDLQQSASKNIDFRTCFCSVVPILIALRHLFRGSCWAPEAYCANIIIDDPPLWERYGHLELRELAALADRTGCACTIAMIPWNYRRSDRRAVSLLASRQPRLDVCIHGCNHSGAEFGCEDREKVTRLLLTGKRRMDAHQRLTGLSHQPVMVFPQGVFSVEAMDCLRSAGYLAAVNTEVADCWGQVHVTLQDLLQTAVLCYNGPPLFSRRRPEDGTINFAVDSYLGKPCLVVLHHDFFKGGVKKLEELVSSFANFRPQPSWENLENIVHHCAVSRRETDGRKTVRIFADRAVMQADEQLTLIKREKDGNKIRSVSIDDESVDFGLEDGFLKCSLEPRTKRTVSIKIVTEEGPAVRIIEDSPGEKARIAVRRYLCEFRDNYLARSETLLRSLHSVSSFLKNI
jgi:hypothetical protein